MAAKRKSLTVGGTVGAVRRRMRWAGTVAAGLLIGNCVGAFHSPLRIEIKTPRQAFDAAVEAVTPPADRTVSIARPPAPIFELAAVRPTTTTSVPPTTTTTAGAPPPTATATTTTTVASPTRVTAAFISDGLKVGPPETTEPTAWSPPTPAIPPGPVPGPPEDIFIPAPTITTSPVEPTTTTSTTTTSTTSTTLPPPLIEAELDVDLSPLLGDLGL